MMMSWLRCYHGFMITLSLLSYGVFLKLYNIIAMHLCLVFDFYLIIYMYYQNASYLISLISTPHRWWRSFVVSAFSGQTTEYHKCFQNLGDDIYVKTYLVKILVSNFFPKYIFNNFMTNFSLFSETWKCF